MKSGMLWFDSSVKPLKEKIEDAATRYRQRYQTLPDTVHVNPSDAGKDSANVLYLIRPEIFRIKVIVSSKTLQHHIWIGRVGM